MSAQSYMLVYVFLSASYINSLKFENTLHLQNYVLLPVWKGKSQRIWRLYSDVCQWLREALRRLTANSINVNSFFTEGCFRFLWPPWLDNTVESGFRNLGFRALP